MEYRRLLELDNKYPNLRNYQPSKINNQILLKGIYSDINEVEFNYTDIKTITPVENTKFRFIACIKKDASDKKPKYFTSLSFYEDFVTTIDENNPYLLLSAFDVRTFTFYEFFDTLKIFEENKKLEEEDLVFMNKNIFIDEKSEIDYTALVQYIDWVVSTPDNLDFETGGVKSAELLGIWTQLEIDPDTGKALSKKTVQEKRDTKNFEAKLKNLQEELNNIESDISLYTAEIRRRNYPRKGLSVSELKVIGKLEEKTYTSGKHFLAYNKQDDDIRKLLTEYQNTLKARKSETEKTIADLLKTKPNEGATGGSQGNVTDLNDKDTTRIGQINEEIEILKKEIKGLSPFNQKYLINRKKISQLEQEKRDIKAGKKSNEAIPSKTETPQQPTESATPTTPNTGGVRSNPVNTSNTTVATNTATNTSATNTLTAGGTTTNFQNTQSTTGYTPRGIGLRSGNINSN